MDWGLSHAATRFRLVTGHLLGRLGLRGDPFLLFLALLIGVVTAGAAVGFHELINLISQNLYTSLGPRWNLYGWGLPLLIVFPALGGLVVGLVSQGLYRDDAAPSMTDVLDAVVRSNGIIRSRLAVEKIFTSAVTIGSGGSAGAEGPIVQIGAALASGIGRFFHVARQQLPVLIGCGSAAGISAIFNSPIGGVLFTLEVVLQDFSMRTFTPVVLASVIANITTQAIFRHLGELNGAGAGYDAIFAVPQWVMGQHGSMNWGQVGNFAVLGLLCGGVGVAFTRLFFLTENVFGRLKIPRWSRPALGGGLLGVMGVVYVMVLGWWMLGQEKPFSFEQYTMPAFFGDGYGVIRAMLQQAFYTSSPQHRHLLIILLVLTGTKVVGTCLTLASGGSGGIIAPSLFLGASTGALFGTLLADTGLFVGVQPEVYALVGMGATLAAVVHAPLTAILILFDLTHDHKIMLPAMLASIIATGLARSFFRDSIYTYSLRRRGVRAGTMADLTVLRRLSVEQVPLEPACIVRPDDEVQHVLDLTSGANATDVAVADASGAYRGMITLTDLRAALVAADAIPLLLADDLVRGDIPTVGPDDDLATVLEVFAQYDTDYLPVCPVDSPGKIIGLLSRSTLMRTYQQALTESV